MTPPRVPEVKLTTEGESERRGEARTGRRERTSEFFFFIYIQVTVFIRRPMSICNYITCACACLQKVYTGPLYIAISSTRIGKSMQFYVLKTFSI